MDVERDWLCTRVFPELRERLRERFHYLETIDLRWGIESASEYDERAREMLVLKVCLREIARSRPFIIGLLGDRYGYQPPPAQIRAAAREAGLEQDVAGKSVTELEILFGVLESTQQQQRRSWFYLREPLPYVEMSPEFAARYSERYNAEPGGPAKADHLDALKRRLLTELPERTRRYRAEWDAERRTVTGLQAFGNQVRDDLWSDLVAETDASLRQVPQTWQGRDRRALDEFVEDRSRSFVGREAISAKLMALARQPALDKDVWGTCVTAAAGAGKSGLFAYLHRELEVAGVLLLAHAAGISVQSTSVDRMLRRWVSELASFLAENDPLGDDAKVDDIDREFARLLGRASMQKRVVVLIDALNQFEPSTRGLHLTWLPQLWPANARLVATTIAGAHSAALLGRPRVREVKLPAIDAREAAAILRGICKGYHRELSPRVVDALLAKRRSDGAFAHGSPLWLELAVEELNLLDADDFERADVEFSTVPSGAERMVCLLLAATAAMPAEVADAYGVLFDRAAKLFGAPWTRAFLQVTAVSRGGWRESDLQVLMPRRSGVAWDELAFAGLRRILRAHVAQWGGQGQWDFTHAQMREAVTQQMARDGVDALELHAQIADHLLKLPREDPLHVTETMVHLESADDRDRAAAYFAGRLTEAELAGATTALLNLLLADSEQASGLAWIMCLADPQQLREGKFYERVSLFDSRFPSLYEALCRNGQIKSRLRFLEKWNERLRSFESWRPTNLNCKNARVTLGIYLGDALRSLGRDSSSLTEYQAALIAAKQLAPIWPALDPILTTRLAERSEERGDLVEAKQYCESAISTWKKIFSSVHEGTTPPTLAASMAGPMRILAKLLSKRGHIPESIEVLSKAVAVLDGPLGSFPNDSHLLGESMLCYGAMSKTCLAANRLDEALLMATRALAIAKALVAADPNDRWASRHLGVMNECRGDVLMSLGAAGEALHHYRLWRSLANQAATHDSMDVRAQFDMASAYQRIAAAFGALGRSRAMSAYRARFQGILRRLADAGVELGADESTALLDPNRLF